MDIAFNINPLGMEGLGATLTSLVRNCSNSKKLNLWFLCSDLKKKDKSNICKLLKDGTFQGNSEFIDFNSKAIFGHFRSLHGDWTPYGRLLIPDIIKSNKALYLDSDLIVEADVLELENFTTDNILSAVRESAVIYALENSFFIQKLNWHPDTAYFNSGVLLFNIAAWKASNVEQKIKEISDKYPQEFLSADQTLLNAICKGAFTYLPQKYNLPWYPSAPKPDNTEDAIIHFVGSPKPWDLFGQTVHAGYETWKAYNTQFWKKKYGHITVGKLKRTWNIRGSIFRNIKHKLNRK